MEEKQSKLYDTPSSKNCRITPKNYSVLHFYIHGNLITVFTDIYLGIKYTATCQFTDVIYFLNRITSYRTGKLPRLERKSMKNYPIHKLIFANLSIPC